MNREFQKGDTVKLKPGITHDCPEGREDHPTAIIAAMLTGTHAGGVMTKYDLHGCKYWNVADLELVKAFEWPYSKVSPLECDLKVGDVVTYTNENGVCFPGRVVVGFRESYDPEWLTDRFIHIDSDAHWFPKKRSELKLEKTGPNIPACDYQIDMNQH